LFYDAYGSKYPPGFNSRSEYDVIKIPAAFVTYEQWQKLRANDANVIAVKMNIRLVKPDYTGNNIAAFIDNKAPLTVVLGAHYDHLGHGEDGGSLYSGKAPQIHNGADDNASGTAALMQLAAWAKKSRLKGYNYLFVHFSGEELGLLGSKAFTKIPGIDSSHIAYMINMDMVGRLNDSTHALTLGGVGTSPAWADALAAIRKNDFKVNVDSAGVGPSDHTSFYNKGIPVLFFFTGIHSDYHKPGDDADKINYAGEARIIRSIGDVVKQMDKAPRPRFTPTKQSSMGRVRFKVTLGIIPDYSWTGEGLRADGISPGKAAERAGMQAGDLIIRLGNDEVKGIQTYMEALSHQAPGAKTTVVILRDGKKMELPVEFK
jgi:Zn-dependent M28 family amino/carboxypeptidase